VTKSPVRHKLYRVLLTKHLKNTTPSPRKGAARERPRARRPVTMRPDQENLPRLPGYSFLDPRVRWRPGDSSRARIVASAR
jgi:hypothetical protein